MQIELTDAEAINLRELLRESLSDLSAEIAGTDNAGYREGLRTRRASLEAILSQLDREGEHASTG